MIKVNTKELINNLDKYLQYVEEGHEVVIIKNGKETVKLIPYKKEEDLSDCLVGVLKNDYNLNNIKQEKYEKGLN